MPPNPTLLRRMFLACTPAGSLAVGLGSHLLCAVTGTVGGAGGTPSTTTLYRTSFPAPITGLSPLLSPSHPDGLVCMVDDKSLQTLAPSPTAPNPGVFAPIDVTTVPRRGASLAVLPGPPSLGPGGGGGATSSGVVVVGDKTGDVWAFGELPQVSRRRRHLLGHTASIVTSIALCPGKGGDPYLLTADRDEKVRVSRWDAPYSIASFCLGHTRAVSSVVTLPGVLDHFVSAGGDGTLRLWNASTGTLLHTVYFKEGSSGGGSGSGSGSGGLVAFPTPSGVAHMDPDLTFSKREPDEMGGGGGGGEEDEGEGEMEGGGEEEVEGGVVGGSGGGQGGGQEEGGGTYATATTASGSSTSSATTTGATLTFPLPPYLHPIPDSALGVKALAPSSLPPQIVPASLVAFALPTGHVCVTAFIVGESTVRLFGLEKEREGEGAVCVPSAEEGGAPCTQHRLRPLGTLTLSGGATPLQMILAHDTLRASTSHPSLHLVAVLAPSSIDPHRWVYQVRALRALRCVSGGVGGLEELDAATIPGLPTLNAALEEPIHSPAGITPASVTPSASLLTLTPHEYDKASYREPGEGKRSRLAAEAATKASSSAAI